MIASPINEQVIKSLRSKAISIGEVLAAKQEIFPDGGIYIVFRGHNPVYVGKTKRSLKSRIKSHMVDNTLLGKDLNQSLGGFYVIALDDNLKAIIPIKRVTENSLIKWLCPEYNRFALPRSEWTGKAKQEYLEEQKRKNERLAQQKKYQGFYYGIMNEIDRLLIVSSQGARKYLQEKAHEFAVEGNENLDQDEIKHEIKRKAWELLLEEINKAQL